jgi:hypothetical protein
MLKKLGVIFSLIQTQVFAQDVTASFDPKNIGFNPASTATREVGIISPLLSTTLTTQKITDAGK